MSQRRTYIIEPEFSEDGELIVREDQLQHIVMRMLSTLVAVGGDVSIRADRVKVGELPGQPRPCPKCKGSGQRVYSGATGACRSCEGQGVKLGPPEPLGQTMGFIVRWEPVPLLADEPLTSKLMDAAVGEAGAAAQTVEQAEEVKQQQALEEEEEPVDAGDEPSPEALELMRDVHAELEADDGDAGDEDGDDGEPECNCDGDHVPPCPFAGAAERDD